MIRLLLLEDEPRIASFIQRGLASEGYDVTCVGTGEAALKVGLEGGYDVIVLDVMLPDMSGMEVCEKLRSGGVSVPIMMLTARDANEDVIEGLDRGADDYLAKPFAFDVLLARLAALLRRGATVSTETLPQKLRLSGLVLDRGRRECRVNGSVLDLTRLEFEVLWLLAADPDRVHSRERILSAAWGAEADPMTNVVDVYIARIRKKLAANTGPGIETVRGVGYRISDLGGSNDPRNTPC